VETRATRRPGQKGTRKHLEQFGDRLLFVRYRYNPETNTRLTTVEVIVDERPAHPASAQKAQVPASALQATPVLLSGPEPKRPVAPAPVLAAVRIEAREQALRNKVKAAGGYWDSRRGLWLLRADRVRPLGLESRLVPPGPDDLAI
jgi:hypothetical protein